MTERSFFLAGMLLILGIAAALRVTTVMQTVVDSPIRADARVYFANAHNLRYHGVLSDSLLDFGGEEPVEPSAKVPPGYPIFLSLFIDGSPDGSLIRSVTFMQAVLGILTVLMAGLLARHLLGTGGGLLVAFLTAISPHLVNYNVYLLTESLFTFLLLGGVLFLALLPAARSRRSLVMFAVAAAIVLGLAALTRSVLYAFIVPAAVIAWWTLRQSDGRIVAAVLVLVFATVLSPWFLRNAMNVSDESGRTVLNASFQHGMYPGFMYGDRPETYGYPYRHDPWSTGNYESTSRVFTEIARRFREEPLRHVTWYLFGKPLKLWQWGSVQGAGEIGVYPLVHSPYAQPGVHHLSFLLSRLLHWPLVLLGAFMSVVLFTPVAQRYFTGEQLHGLRVTALVPIYFTAVLMVLAPYPRFSVPLRPELYILSIAGALLLWRWWQAGRGEPVEATSDTSAS